MNFDFKRLYFVTGILAISLCTNISFAQTKEAAKAADSKVQRPAALPGPLMPPHPADKMEQRYFNIDAKTPDTEHVWRRRIAAVARV